MPSKRIELSTPGLLDQCSNHWATKALPRWQCCRNNFSSSYLILNEDIKKENENDMLQISHKQMSRLSLRKRLYETV
jgi:hypothetical protein